MFFFHHIKPASLFLASLTVLATSNPLPVSAEETTVLRQLTGTTFSDSIKSEIWFVEFFSPWCGHCKSFKPTWEKLVESKDDPPRLNLAQVDCVANGDLCKEQEVKYYPQMRLFKDGKQIEVYSGDRSLDKLEKYLDDNAPPPPRYTPPIAVAPPMQKYNLAGQVLELTPDTFYQKTGSEPTFVKFYAPWCHHCQKLAPTWIELAASLKGVANVAEVNCDSHGALCRKAGVEGYPTLIFFHNGQKADYTGAKKLDPMKVFVEKAIAPGVVTVSAKTYGDMLKSEEVLYLLLHSHEDISTPKLVEQASQVLLGTPRIFKCTDEELYEQYKVPPYLKGTPVLLTIKGHSSSEYTTILSLAVNSGPTRSSIESFLVKNKLPLGVQLTQDNFLSIMKNPAKPYVVLAALSPETVGAAMDAYSSLLRETAKEWIREVKDGKEPERDVAFVWMDGDKWEKWLKNMYGLKKANFPGVVVADHENLLYYDTDPKGRPIQLAFESIAGTLRQVYAGEAIPKNSESIFERTGRRLNANMVALEHWVWENPKKLLLFAAGFIFAFVICLKKCVDADLPNDYVPEKNKANGRLD